MHLFTKEARQEYNLEGIWGEGSVSQTTAAEVWDSDLQWDLPLESEEDFATSEELEGNFENHAVQQAA